MRCHGELWDLKQIRHVNFRHDRKQTNERNGDDAIWDLFRQARVLTREARKLEDDLKDAFEGASDLKEELQVPKSLW